jgi:hypothetical protein
MPHTVQINNGIYLVSSRLFNALSGAKKGGMATIAVYSGLFKGYRIRQRQEQNQRVERLNRL